MMTLEQYLASKLPIRGHQEAYAIPEILIFMAAKDLLSSIPLAEDFILPLSEGPAWSEIVKILAQYFTERGFERTQSVDFEIFRFRREADRRQFAVSTSWFDNHFGSGSNLYVTIYIEQWEDTVE